jgi:hypothetical protein
LVFFCPNRFNGRCFMHGVGFGRWRWSRSMRSRPIGDGCGSCVCTALRPKVEIRCFPDVAPVKSQSKSCVVIGTENADETFPKSNHQLRVRESWRYDWVSVKTFQHCDISGRRTRPPPHRSIISSTGSDRCRETFALRAKLARCIFSNSQHCSVTLLPT